MRHEEFMNGKFREEKMEMSTLPSEMAQDIIDTADRIGRKIDAAEQAGKEAYGNVDMVNSPSHYNQSGIECIAAIQAALGPNFKYYLQGNIMKYLWRFDYKGRPLEDLEKAQWYLNTLLEDVAASDES